VKLLPWETARYETLLDLIQLDIETDNRRTELRGGVLAVLDEMGYWTSVNEARQPEEERVEHPSARCPDRHMWADLAEDFRTEVLEDYDFDLELSFLDLDPEASAARKHSLNIDRDYFTDTSEDPAQERLQAVRRELHDAPPFPRPAVELPPSATAGGRSTEVPMNDDFTARQRAITFRLAGRPVKHICLALGRTDAWFHKWWRRYLDFGVDGLYDLTRATHHVARRIPPELERIILTIGRRLESHTGPGARYRLAGASALLAELKALGIRPLPSLRTIDRVLQRNGITLPRVRLARLLPRQAPPFPQAERSNQLHEVDLVGPIYLKGRGKRYYLWVGKDAFDGAVCLRLAYSREMDELLEFLGECWKTLGIPEQVQLDNAREISGWGHAARYLSRVIRLCLSSFI
jgi:hypothetical protein